MLYRTSSYGSVFNLLLVLIVCLAPITHSLSSDLSSTVTSSQITHVCITQLQKSTSQCQHIATGNSQPTYKNKSLIQNNAEQKFTTQTADIHAFYDCNLDLEQLFVINRLKHADTLQTGVSYKSIKWQSIHCKSENICLLTVHRHIEREQTWQRTTQQIILISLCENCYTELSSPENLHDIATVV